MGLKTRRRVLCPSASGVAGCLPPQATSGGGVALAAVGPGRLVEGEFLLGGRDVFARLDDLGLNIRDRALEFLPPLQEGLDKDRVDNTGLVLAASGPGLLLDFPVQPLRIAPQPGRQGFEPGQKAAPFVEFPAVLAETALRHAHRGGSSEASALGGCVPAARDESAAAAAKIALNQRSHAGCRF